MSLFTKALLLIGITVGQFLLSKVASAHEAYVLTPEQFYQGLHHSGINPFTALSNPDNLIIFGKISFGLTVVIVSAFLFGQSVWGKKLESYLTKFSSMGVLFLRLAIACSLFLSALNWDFLGPELSLLHLPYPQILQWGMLCAGILFFFGLFTEIATVVSLVIFFLGLAAFHSYTITYFNYLGEIIALLLLGSREISLDRLFFGKRNYLAVLIKYEGLIIRIFYGLALSYAAISIKLLHPVLTMTVIKNYHLTQFNWLFPQDPLLATLGAGLSELTIGIFIIIGFQMKLVVFVSLFYITLSLFFFREAVWPHFMLYGISLFLLFTKENFTLTGILQKTSFVRSVVKKIKIA